MESCSDVLELTEILKDSHTVLENLLLSIFQPLVPAQKAALQGIIKQNKHDTFTLYYDILELVDCSTDNCTSLSRKVSEALKKTNLFGVSGKRYYDIIPIKCYESLISFNFCMLFMSNQDSRV